MKISRPGSPQPSAAAGKASGAARSTGKGFAAKLEKAAAQSSATAEPASPARTRASLSVADLGADLRAGRITPQAAIDKVIDRIVAKQLGIHAGPAAKEKLGGALREHLADDPLLAAKIRALSDD
jgi:hypothetical protein